MFWNKNEKLYCCEIGINTVIVRHKARTLDAALEVQTTLVSLKKYVQEAVAYGESFSEAFPVAVQKALAEVEEEKKPELRFGLKLAFITTRAAGKEGICDQINLHVTENSARQIADVWTRLLAVRNEGWPACRSIFLESWRRKQKDTIAEARAEALDLALWMTS